MYQDLIFSTAIDDGMPAALANLIAAQAAHETGNFTSAVFIDCNNAFGYNAVRSFCLGHSIYQNYPTVQDSVHELTGWIKRRLAEGNFPRLDTITTAQQYAQLLKDNGYFSDSVQNYANGIAAYLTAHKIQTGAVLVAGLFLFLLLRKKGKS
jgi:uncharacterized FlgJ-related protein